MACSNCGSTLPCPCSQQFQTGVGRTCVDPCGTQQGCNPNDCCSSSLPASPVPFYACVPSCPESHTQTLVQQQFYFDISGQNSWNIPSCGNTAILAVPGLKSLNVGSYIWNALYGYFEITAFDITTGQVTVLNHCNAGNAAVGTTVPACTLFTVTVPPCDCGTETAVCVAIDFTAPAIGNCLDITLTDTVGLQESNTVEIGTGFYFLSTIKPNNIVTICNQGDGILAGTPVIAKDADGKYQYCLSVTSNNPCNKVPIAAGRVLVCDGSGEIAPLTGGVAGEVLVLTNPVNGDADYQDVITPLQVEIDVINAALPCLPQTNAIGVPASLYSIPITLGGSGTFETVVDSSVVSVTTPNDCPSAFYSVRAEVNIIGLQDHDSGPPPDGVIMQEMQLAWSLFEVGGRVCWTDYGSDGFDTIPGPYPPTTEDAIWGILQIDGGFWPMMYNGSSITNSITLAANTAVDLVLRYKTVIGENNPPSIVNSAAIYLIGTVYVERVP